jgi:hypothetical protein
MIQIFATVIAFIVAVPLLLIETGWAISTLWNWFVHPLGLPSIGIVTGIGFSVLFAAIRARPFKNDKDSTIDENIKYLIGIYLFPLASVAIGWIALKFA